LAVDTSFLGSSVKNQSFTPVTEIISDKDLDKHAILSSLSVVQPR
jgi:hypothetical protein